MSVTSSTSADAPVGDRGVSPVAGEYEGYAFPTNTGATVKDDEDAGLSERASDERSGAEDEPAAAEREADPAMLKDAPGTSAVAACLLGLFALAFCITLVFALLGAACKMDLCSAPDVSASKEAPYRYRSFHFSVPMQYVLAVLSACFLVGAVSAFKALDLFKQGVGTPCMVDMATRMRKGSRAFLVKQFGFAFLLAAIALGPIWASSNWRVALCFISGLACSALSSFVGVSVATRGNLRTASAALDSLPTAAAVCYKTGSVVGLAMTALGLGGASLSYLLFRDIRALVGFSAGTSVLALVSRFSGGLFASASEKGTFYARKIGQANPDDSLRNPGPMVNGVGDSIGDISGMGSDFLETLVTCVVATSLLGSSLPFFENNAYALCVHNHLSIDKLCVSSAPAAPNVSTSIAAAICRQGDKYLDYPELRMSQAVSIFVALPFIIGMVGLLASAFVSFRMPAVPDELDFDADGADGIPHPSGPLVESKILRSMQINTLLASVLVLVGSAVACFTMFGASSAFTDGLNGPNPGVQLPRYQLKRGPDNQHQCATIFLGDNTDRTKTLVPDGDFVQSSYQPMDSFGRSLPPANETSWRLFLCTFLGLFLGMSILALTSFFVDTNFSPTRITAMAGSISSGEVLRTGVGVGLLSPVGPFILIVSTILCCDSLYGSYGVGIAATSMISIIGVTASSAAFCPVARNSKALTKLAALPLVARQRAYVLESVGKSNAATGKGFSAASAFLASYLTISAIFNDSGLAPNPFDLVNEQFGSTNPIRHISDVDRIALMDSGIVAGTFVGFLIPFLFTSIILAAWLRSTQTIVDEIRRQFVLKPEPVSDEDTVNPDGATCVDRAGRNALLEAFAPVFVAGFVPLTIGFGLGQRSLLGFLLSVAGSSYLLSVFMTTAGGTWENAMRLVGSGEFGEENGAGSEWYSASFDGNSVGSVFKDAAGPSIDVLSKFFATAGLLSVAFMHPGESSKWWIGLIMFFCSIFLLFASSVVMKKRRERHRIPEPKKDDKKSDKPKVDARFTSPFSADGPTIPVSALAPGGMLRREYKVVCAGDNEVSESGPTDFRQLPAFKSE